MVEVVVLVVVGCVVVVRACEVVVVWVVALWAAGEYKGNDPGPGWDGSCWGSGRWSGRGSATDGM